MPNLVESMQRPSELTDPIGPPVALAPDRWVTTEAIKKNVTARQEEAPSRSNLTTASSVVQPLADKSSVAMGEAVPKEKKKLTPAKRSAPTSIAKPPTCKWRNRGDPVRKLNALMADITDEKPVESVDA